MKRKKYMPKSLKWMYLFIGLQEGKQEICPDCGGNHLDYGYVILNQDRKAGYGAIWCEDCHHGVPISRIIIRDEASERKIVAEIPDYVIFVG